MEATGPDHSRGTQSREASTAAMGGDFLAKGPRCSPWSAEGDWGEKVPEPWYRGVEACCGPGKAAVGR